ncbi:hypothetical protein ASG54_24805 [Aureimonas sp. Leaf460]|uniref:hypothetical protein n=1 Tax=Aureimonas sp. Leaf460 TaxID=1736384 RepID=UPI0006F4396A|nr:hypothetical protein [Aureimonas sp. Leaf460]KQT60680.1 hypothetical protein ASG54_24805 [Aureimonas sp. Leaf460]KQT68809.1 hypothetical protein ASG62_18325 [Aureimonas sp. Leaf427]
MRLAELALENGWPVDEVAGALFAMLGATDRAETVVIETSSPSDRRSDVVRGAFERRSSGKG